MFTNKNFILGRKFVCLLKLSLQFFVLAVASRVVIIGCVVDQSMYRVV